MNNKVLQILEFNKIIEKLTAYASCEPGVRLCSKLRPDIDFHTIVQNQEETAAAVNRLRLFGNLTFPSVSDIGESLKSLAVDSSLSLNELYKIKILLEVVEKAYSYKEKADNENYSDSLSEYFEELSPVKDLKKELDRCIVSEDQVADSASSNLSKLRRQLKNIESRLHTELNNILQAHREYMMDAIITQRNGSYCLPIKSEYKNRVQGIIHDQSSTGSTVFIEPIAIVRMNNEIKEIEIAEALEIEKILFDLSKNTAAYTYELDINNKLVAKLDFIYAKARLANQMKASKPLFNEDSVIELKEARHPLLDPKQVVPVNISLGSGYKLLIITGPNTGGKTVLMKTVGLLTVMGQSGLHIPAFDGSRLSVYKNVFADIGDEQSIEQNLSTFSAHMKNIIYILKAADDKSLCLFDELGAGTDPTEGAALAIAVLDELKRRGSSIMASTHYSELKAYALNTEGVENASCEFDVETLRPTYRILIGVPGKSNAFAISQKLGLPMDIISEARKHISSDAISFEDLITKLETDRITLEKSRLEIEKKEREISSLKSSYDKSLEKINSQKEKLLEKARQEAQSILEEAKETADSTIRNINKIASGLGAPLEKERDRLRNSIKENESKNKKNIVKSSPAKKVESVNIGDSVFIHSLNLKGTVSTLPNDKGILTVQTGIISSKVNINDLELLDEKNDNTLKRTATRRSQGLKSLHISPEVNLIGMNVDEACSVLDKYLDDALLAHLEYVRIIHGRGSGALQKGIHAYLKRQSFVKSFKLAEFDDGGNAVTIVRF
jgi:mutS2 family protein